ncbi:hypothetical protein BGZ61DRAFT_590307 [Ilyonectria robusta]|uniref:uncharacterized protein n=1 Tax=Ilyonectria robusta TaxID=1079257 RepID=UPI001E8EA747|nr:uncharacterized protein BGZ61DRAFT_590307 [Ilyonectria robusta]KAH8683480.1 hypothetical protein BGZ61DRAFT_590307 [Ilyonectria robusta]
MASFVQPVGGDTLGAECEDSRFRVYCSSILPANERFAILFQFINFTLGITAIAVPLVLFLIYYYLQYRKLQSRKIPTARARRRDSDASSTNNGLPMHSFRPTKSFTFLSDTASSAMSVHRDSRAYDLVVLPLDMKGSVAGQDGDSRSSICTTNNEGVIAKMALASVDIDSFGSDALEPSQIEATADFLADTYLRNSLAGFALSCSNAKKPEQMDGLLERLYRSRIPVILSCEHDSEALDSVCLTYASGLIIENALILPNGERRDYFRARRFRHIIGRAHKEREERPDFFIGFLDRWARRPHPATIRRAVKLAEHFGAVIEHGPVDPNYMLKVPITSATQTLSGFEYLRRAETIELQKSWVSETRRAHVPNGSPFDTFASLPLDELDRVIPRASQLLKPRRLGAALQAIAEEKPELHSSPDYVDLAPPRSSFWTSSSDGRTLASKGCFPLTSEPHGEHYEAIVDTQTHLKDLNMLHPVEASEEQTLVATLSAMTEQEGCNPAVHDLINSLVSHQVRIYKGMDTGFRVPDSDAHFWGVSKAREGCVEIYVSQKAPSDAAVVLHTWLAHQRTPRVRRYEQELLLERANNDSNESGIPLCIRSTIESATYSEVLTFVQKLRVSNLDHPMCDAMKEYCWTYLIDQTTKASWTLTCAEKVLDGSLSMQQILRMRLEHYVRLGATELPALDDLVTLHKLTEKAVEDALFFGQRETLNSLTKALLRAYDPWKSWSECDYVDINAELFAIIFFSILRGAAFEEVYNESTDRCPMFLSQPDQAAVFSELWILGSQCDIYFGLLPRNLGNIVYQRYRSFLADRPPTAADRPNDEIMTMYFSPDAAPPVLIMGEEEPIPGAVKMKRTPHEIMQEWKKRFAEAGAMSIFCVPAIVDVLLLTFLGRGFFMTAFMGNENIEAAGYALLVSLLLTAGVTGWVGSTGNYYLAHYAYDNMVYFHVQRLSGGFFLTLLISIVGLIMFTVRFSIGTGFVFVAYLVCISTHFNLLGIMSAMHQLNSPITSGRSVLLQNMPLLLLSPLISTFVRNHDLEIYIPIMFTYVFLTLYRYRRLCHEWSNWMDNIPKFAQKDIIEWYTARLAPESCDEDIKDQDALAVETFVAVLESYQRRTREAKVARVFADPFIGRIAKGMPYVDWLFKKTNPNGDHPDAFSTAWFTQLNESKNQQSMLVRGLKDHNVFTLFRLARYDVGQTLGLFLVALMDRWVMMVWSAGGPYEVIYRDPRARFGICLAIIYFCVAAMLLDSTLYKYWGLRDTISKEKLRNFDHAQNLAKEFEAYRRASIVKALSDIMSKLLFVFGITTILMWVFVDGWKVMVFYYMYVVGYTCSILFQFNRCFTTNVTTHISIIMSSAVLGFITGCVLHVLPATKDSLFIDLAAQNTAAVFAALGTSLWTWKDWAAPSPTSKRSGSRGDDSEVFVQHRLSAEESVHEKAPSANMRKNFSGMKIWSEDGKIPSKKITKMLGRSLEYPNQHCDSAPWSRKLMRTALEMWSDRKITVKVVSREDFGRAGLGELSAFSSREGDVLQLTVGFMKEAELSLPAWQPLLSTVIGECILYHVARSEFRLSHNQAVQAEHFLQGTESVSKRIEFELSFEDVQHLNRLVLKTEMEMMKHLCLDFNVDADWETTPEDVRVAILRRISGEPVAMSSVFNDWAALSKVNLHTEDFHISLILEVYQKCQERLSQVNTFASDGQGTVPETPAELRPVVIATTPKTLTFLQSIWSKIISVPFVFVKWVAIISGGGSNMERELVYCLRNVPLRGVFVYILVFIWNCCRKMKNFWVYWILIYHRPALVNISRLAQKGARRKILKSSVIVELPRKTITGFAATNENGTMMLRVFAGALKDAPADGKALYTDTYDDELRLRSREDASGGFSTYQYDSGVNSRWPMSKVIAKDDSRSVGYYDKYGRVVRGTWTLGETEFVFQYHYKSVPKGNADVLRADFKLAHASSDDMLSVFWGNPVNTEEYTWVPSKNIGLIIKKIGNKTYTSQYEYLHRRDPDITTFMEENGIKISVLNSPEIFPNESSLMPRPKNLSFDADDLLIYHSTLQIRQMRRYAGSTPTLISSMNPISWIVLWRSRMYGRVPTWRIRTELWSHWLKSGTLDAVTACWMDELVLREEFLLRQYWKARDTGRLDEARRALDANIVQIVAAIEIETDISEVSLLTIKTSDLYAMGLSNDATQVTARPQDCFNDTNERVSVIFNDIGCWPVAPGGVSNCRRDLVNGHKTIRNHVLSECANDYGIPRFQIEKNVQSLKLLPLWGIDGGTANHGVIENILESQVDEKVADTDIQRDIVGVFVPLLMEFVKGARTKRLSRADLIKYSNTFLSMAKYYELKDYAFTWQSKEVEDAWVAAWLTHYDDTNITNPSQCFEIERPSIPDFRTCLGIYKAYFFIFAVNVPEECPQVFQSTHHGISSLFGLVLKYRRGANFGIWDHAILWRECCLNISAAQSELPLSVQSMLLAGMGLATRLAYFHADVITPCASLFNPMWEAEIGTEKGTISNRNQFCRKIDPIVNGISNMESFTPVDKIRTDTPTVVMLSNVQVIKGVKAAIQAADIIINRFGFTDYKLVVYGAKDRQPAYALEMEKFIVDHNLGGKVILAGFGNPKEVLKDAWLFMNSSISEGLPLAIGEAALAGVPIVATEVGATALVLTDVKNPDQRYGEVVPPNDPMALARAQISILGMVGPWTQFTDEAHMKTEAPQLPDEITPEDVTWLSERFYQKSEYRRKLGLLSREVVLHSFHGNRYLREHEQMFWIQSHQSKMRKDYTLAMQTEHRFKFGTPSPLRYCEDESKRFVVDPSWEREETMLQRVKSTATNKLGTIREKSVRRRSKLMKKQPPPPPCPV